MTAVPLLFGRGRRDFSCDRNRRAHTFYRDRRDRRDRRDCSGPCFLLQVLPWRPVRGRRDGGGLQ